MRPELTVLIIGGYGTFGGRIVELLEVEARLTLVVAGRSIAKARAYCAGRDGVQARLLPAAFDRDGDLGAQLASIGPDIVVDASGPFQSYGHGRYRLVETCIARGLNYLDLADGADFVAGIAVFDDVARGADLFVLSGASSFPMLTAAVVRRLSADMAKVSAIRGGVAPSPYAGVGENVIRAIASYAGRPILMRRDGATGIGHPLTEQIRYTIAPPGRVPLGNRLFSLVDVPDLRMLADQWPDVHTVWMSAAPVPEILHRALIALAWLVRAGLLRSLLPLAPLMHWATNRLRWGEHRGGMFVEVEGTDDAAAPARRSWHLLAEGNDGPLIPSMAVAALVRKTLAGHPPTSGARSAMSDLELDDYETLFGGRTLHTGIRDEPADDTRPLYARILGSAWDSLPAEIRDMHDVAGTKLVEGRAKVERGRNPLARLAGRLVGFPKAAADISVRVRFDVDDGIETWTRTFGGETFSSSQFAGRGRSECLVCERFGPLTFAFALVAANGRLDLVLRRWSAFGVPLPLWFSPRTDSCETAEGGRFRFNVRIWHPLAGLIVRYDGWLQPPPRE